MAKDEAPKKRAGERVRKREIERLRAQKRRQWVTWLTIGAVVAVALLVVAATVKPPVTSCDPHVVCGNSAMHIHPKLYFYNGAQMSPVPGGVGVDSYADHSLDHFLDLKEGQVGKLAPIHTHDNSGLVHVEASVTRGFTLGEFFAIWGQPLGASATWTFASDSAHRITLKVNGVENSDWGELVLKDGQVIEVHRDEV